MKKIAFGGTGQKEACSVAAVIRSRLPLVLKGGKVKSVVPEQPFGMEEGLKGAIGRAQAALDAQPDAEFGLGIENFFTYAGHRIFIDMAAVALIDRADGEITSAFSVGIPGPHLEVGKAISAGQDETAGTHIAARTGWDSADWHKQLLGGRLSRFDLLADAVYTVLLLKFPNGEIE